MAQLDLSKVPATVTITNVSEGPLPVQFYGKNVKLTLEATDSVVILARTSVELAYYLSLAGSVLTVEHKEAPGAMASDLE